MRMYAVFFISLLSAVAFGQSAKDDVACTQLTNLEETVCTFGDGTGEIIDATSTTHFTKDEWDKQFPALIKADEKEKQARIKHNEDVAAELKAEHEREMVAIRKRAEREREASAINNKKKCIASGFDWTKTFGCRVKDETK